MLKILQIYEANIFMDILHSANMKQHVSGPTHQKGHTLDLIITRESDDFLILLLPAIFHLIMLP